MNTAYNYVEMLGTSIGNWCVVARDRSTQRGYLWRIRCTCGFERLAYGATLRLKARCGLIPRCPICNAPDAWTPKRKKRAMRYWLREGSLYSASAMLGIIDDVRDNLEAAFGPLPDTDIRDASELVLDPDWAS